MLSPSLSITAKFSTTWKESIALEEWQEDLGSGDKRWLFKWGRDGYQRTHWSQSSNLEINASFKNCKMEVDSNNVLFVNCSGYQLRSQIITSPSNTTSCPLLESNPNLTILE